MKHKSELAKARRERYRADGLCGNCGARPPRPGRKYCEVCAASQRKARRKHLKSYPNDFRAKYHERKASGLCVSCGVPDKPREKGLLCSGCSQTERQRAIRIKQEVMTKYGGSCECCGEDRVAFLTIDHINNDGGVKRRSGEHSGGGHFYKRLRTIPRNPTLRVLCWNCNMGRRGTGICPHKNNEFFDSAITWSKWQRRVAP